MSRLPTGTVTFLFTDIEGSTRLLRDLGDHYSILLADHHRLLRAAVQERGGVEVETQGDGLFFVLPSAKAALLASVAAQRAVLAHTWPEGVSVRVRMGLHTGEPMSGETGYVGLDIHRAARICAAGHGGQILLSRTTRDLVEEDVGERIDLREMGEHRLKDLVRPVQLFQVVVPDLPADFPPLRSLDTIANNLPRQLTSFVGREREISEIRRLLSTTALLTLTGVGGCGKTRLALQVAAEVLDEFKDGVWLVELAPLPDPAFVPQTVAVVLGVREKPGRSILEALTDFLQPKELLIVLDNAEHAIAVCAHVADAVLRTCRNVRILTTSRERLAIAGETVWNVPSLSLPDLRRLPSVDRLAEFEAIRLFTERARAVLPRFKLTDQNALAMAQVCDRLDGLPLAIELAAARVRVLSVEQISARLDDRFRLLTGGGRTTVPRLQTLQAAIDWSFGLLSDQERTLFRRLSVFAGGWTLDAAGAVCSGDGVEVPEILELVTRLVDKSLVVAEGRDKENRYRLLETVREYSHDKLMSGEVQDAHRRHRDWFLLLAEQGEPELRGPDQVAWLNLLEVEHANFRGALQWSLSQHETEAMLRLAGALWFFWYVRGHLTEGRRWLEAALSETDRSPSSARAKALCGAGRMAGVQGDSEVARSLLEESLVTARASGDRCIEASALMGLGKIAQDRGDTVAARALLQESLTISRQLGNKAGIADSLSALGWLAHAQGDYAEAQPLFEEGLAIFREVGDKGRIADVLRGLGTTERDRGNYAASRPLFEESLTLFRELADTWGIGWGLHSLADAAGELGDVATARALFEESLILFRKMGNKVGVAWAFNHLGAIARDQGDYATARPLHEEGLRIFRETGTKRGIGWSLYDLGRLAYLQGDYDRAVALHSEALMLLTESEDKPGIAYSSLSLGHLAMAQGEYTRAVELYKQSLAVFSALGEKQGMAPALHGLGNAALLHQDLTAARLHLERCLGMFREMDDKEGIGRALHSLGMIVRLQGDIDQAAALHRESLLLLNAVGDRRGIVASLVGLAGVACDRGHLERAARLIGAADGSRESIGAALPAADRADYDRNLATVRVALREEAFATAWTEGQAMPLEQAIEYALSER